MFDSMEKNSSFFSLHFLLQMLVFKGGTLVLKKT